MDIKETTNSNKYKIILYILAGIVVILLVFQAGMYAGFKKASFSNRMGQMYFEQMRGGANSGQFSDFNRVLPNAHGAIGQIVSINGGKIVVEDRDGIDKTIRVSSSTVIKGFNGANNLEDLKVNDLIVVFGSPSEADSIVDARLIRTMPSPDLVEFEKVNNSKK